MARRVRDFIEINDYRSLGALIDTLIAIRDTLPQNAEPELKLRGDDVFGRRLTITYLRELTAEEAECYARYTDTVVKPDPDIDALLEKLDDVPYEPDEDANRRAIRAA